MSEENPYATPQTDRQAPVQMGGAPGPHNYATLGERFLGKLTDIILIFRVDRNCLHDDIAKTRVIKFPAPIQS